MQKLTIIALFSLVFLPSPLWAEDTVITTGELARLEVTADRNEIQADGVDLAFITVRVTDKNRLTVPRAENNFNFSIEGPGEIVATDNGDPTNMAPFTSHERQAFNGLCLVIVCGIEGKRESLC